MDLRQSTNSHPISSYSDQIGFSTGISDLSPLGYKDRNSYGNDLLRSLPSNVFGRIEPHLRRISVTREQFLFHQGDVLDCVYFPEKAIVSDLHLLEDGRMVEVAMTGREGAVGIASLFYKDQVPNCVQVMQAGTMLRIESKKLREITRVFPEIPKFFYTTLKRYIRQISQKAVCNMYHSIEARFCTWLLMVSDRSDRDVLRLTHEQIARTLGVYRPSVTCIALELKKRELIDYSRGGITILDRIGIEENACGCYAELESCV